MNTSTPEGAVSQEAFHQKLLDLRFLRETHHLGFGYYRVPLWPSIPYDASRCIGAVLEPMSITSIPKVRVYEPTEVIGKQQTFP